MPTDTPRATWSARRPRSPRVVPSAITAASGAEEEDSGEQESSDGDERPKDETDEDGNEEQQRRGEERREGARRNSERLTRRQTRRSSGRGRYRPGPGGLPSSPGIGMVRTRSADGDLDREVAAITDALREQGPLPRRELADAVDARHWGPGRFRQALEEAVDDGEARRVGSSRYDLAER